MRRSAQWTHNGKSDARGAIASRRISFLRFLLRYPIFLLAFGPPIFRLYTESIDVSRGKIDIWSVIQVSLICTVATRAIWRLAVAQSVFLPKRIRSILILAFILGAFYLASTIYSPSRITSAAYSILYFLTLICVFEFILDVYRNPPNWLQSLFHLRLIALLLYFLALAAFIINPAIAIAGTPELGMRLGGGTVAPVAFICPMIAIISAYAFLYSLESKTKSVCLFLLGFVSAFLTRSRGCELSLLLSLTFLGYFWAQLGRRIKFVVVSGFIMSSLFFGMLVGAIGGGRVWDYFNRGQNLRGIESASGRTDVWYFVLQYCMDHPWGMGYIAGFRTIFRTYYALGIQVDVMQIGNAHNSYLQVLADAGWLAMAIYLIMLVKIVMLALRFAKKQAHQNLSQYNDYSMVIECSLVMLIFCLGGGMEGADLVIPLRTVFYWQFIIIAIILGVSARLLDASRVRHNVLGRQQIL